MKTIANECFSCEKYGCDDSSNESYDHIKCDRYSYNNLYDDLFNIYLSRGVNYQIHKGKLPEVIEYLDSVASFFKPGEGQSRILLKDRDEILRANIRAEAEKATGSLNYKASIEEKIDDKR